MLTRIEAAQFFSSQFRYYLEESSGFLIESSLTNSKRSHVCFLSVNLRYVSQSERGSNIFVIKGRCYCWITIRNGEMTSWQGSPQGFRIHSWNGILRLLFLQLLPEIWSQLHGSYEDLRRMARVIATAEISSLPGSPVVTIPMYFVTGNMLVTLEASSSLSWKLERNLVFYWLHVLIFRAIRILREGIIIYDHWMRLTGTFRCVTTQTESFPLTAIVVLETDFTALNAYSELKIVKKK